MINSIKRKYNNSIKVELGTRNVKFPSEYLKELEDSNQYLNNFEILKEKLQSNGYLLIRNLLDYDQVIRAKLAVIEHIVNYEHETGNTILDPNQLWSNGILAPNDDDDNKVIMPFMEGKNNLTHCSDVLNVLESTNLNDFFQNLFQSQPVSYDYKWLRAMGRKSFTGVHVDNVYMSRGTDKLLTAWIPLGDISPAMGTVAICEGSHRLTAGFKRFQECYGSCDIERENLTGTGWFTVDPYEITSNFGGQWRTTNFQAGDVLIFTLRTVHMSTTNLTDLIRISCDTRWQPANEPIDHRFVGDIKAVEPKYGDWANDQDQTTTAAQVTIETLRSKWRL